MCGIAGIVSPDPEDCVKIDAMTDLLEHRGPDSRGVLRSDPVALGHRRLSIIDLSSDAGQPMKNEDGQLWLVANGEIYNFKELTLELRSKGHVFRSASDCEVILHLYEEYGEAFISRMNGMFAFALWDNRKQKLIAAVDRFGKKPLYYAMKQNRLIFASEMKSLLGFNWVSRQIDYQAVNQYLSLRHIPAPRTMFKDIRKLDQASFLIWQANQITINKYWHPTCDPIRLYDENITTKFQQTLEDAVRVRLQSDVPLGIYLSGGIDSAAIAGLVSRLAKGPKISFTVGFDYAYNEHPRAQKLARHLDIEFNPVTVEAEDFDRMAKMVYHLDEPFGDLLCIPAFLLGEAAKSKLTVALTGDGADEILNGYFHQHLMFIRNRYDAVLRKKIITDFFSRVVNHIPVAVLNTFFNYPDRLGRRERLKLSEAIQKSGRFGAFYESITSCFTANDKDQACTKELSRQFEYPSLADEFQDFQDKSQGFSFNSTMSLLDLKYWIPFSVIYRLDKLNMAHAVETRSPFLDYRVVEMALNLPDEAKFNRRRNKEILRAVIDRMYPKPLREKGKQAFYMPMTSAYQKKYRIWASELLNETGVKHRGLFQWAYVNQLFQLSEKGSMLATRQLTALAILEQWFQIFTKANCLFS